MGVGTVPVVTPEVEMTSYAEAPIEGTHYIRVRNPDELHEKLAGIDEVKWAEMSLACREWWERNCSCRGSWETTIQTALFGTPRPHFSH